MKPKSMTCFTEGEPYPNRLAPNFFSLRLFASQLNFDVVGSSAVCTWTTFIENIRNNTDLVAESPAVFGSERTLFPK